MSSSGPSSVCGLLFDFDNTLVKTTKSDVKAVANVKDRLKINLSDENVELVANEYLKILALNPVDPKGVIDPHEWRTTLWQQAINTLPLNCEKPSAKEIYQLWRNSRLEGMFLDQEVATMLKQLGSKYKLAIITNSHPVIQNEKLQQCGIREYFDAVIISGEQPYPKPHPSIFKTACSIIDVPPEQCVMIGDDLIHDIQGGLNAGMKATVWVKEESLQKLSSDCPKPDFVIDTVKDLPRVLSQLEG